MPSLCQAAIAGACWLVVVGGTLRMSAERCAAREALMIISVLDMRSDSCKPRSC